VHDVSDPEPRDGEHRERQECGPEREQRQPLLADSFRPPRLLFTLAAYLDSSRLPASTPRSPHRHAYAPQGTVGRVFAFATAVSNESIYENVAHRGIRRVAEPDSVVLTRRRLSLADAYNQMLDEAGRLEGLEALVMMHQDTELRDPAFTAKARARLTDPEVAMVGALGVRGVRGGAMWMPDHVGYGRITEELFGLERVLATGNTAGAHEVDALDGFLFVLSPWAVRSLRFDPAFDEAFHSYDLDFCFQARARGKKLVVEQIDVIHRRQPRVIDDSLKKAAAIWRRKWTWDGPAGGPRLPDSHPGASTGLAPAAPARVNGPRRGDSTDSRTGLFERLIAADRRRGTALQDDLIGHDRRVLELGCGSGRTAERLADRGSSVVGVEVDPDAGRTAERACEQVIVGDLDTLCFAEALGERCFDVVLAGGALRRLSRPEAVLRRLLPHLGEGGYLLVRLANVAHPHLRLSAYGARIDDDAARPDRSRPPLTRHTAVAMITSAGYRVGAVKPIEWDLGSELAYCEPDLLSTKLLRLIVSEPDARALEYLILAYPSGRPAPALVTELADQGARGRKVRPLGIASVRQRTREGDADEVQPVGMT
jgi:SAM-dependent methyltransferase